MQGGVAMTLGVLIVFAIVGTVLVGLILAGTYLIYYQLTVGRGILLLP